MLNFAARNNLDYNMKKLKQLVIAAITLFTITLNAHAAEVVYRIVEYNNSTADYTLAASGMIPKGSSVYFTNDYGETIGNRYNQIPKNRKATFYLDGWQGCTIKNITFSMCSNNKSGQIGFTVKDGENQLYRQTALDFADQNWFGQWVSKDLNVYVDITKSIEIPAITAEEASIILQGGTKDGSVYINAITIEYDTTSDVELESPLGWIYEKLAKKSTINDGDIVMIYRNGCAATDYDGMDKSHYLDVVPLTSTKDVTSRDVLCFTLNKAEGNYWTFTDQYGRKLGATGKQALAWDEGNTNWTIALGTDGATITNANTEYGTLRLNTPTEGYARFNIYTSKTLPLPFLYLKVKQNEPETATSLTFDKTEITADLQDAHIALQPAISPKTVTDKRIVWSSNNEAVATVNGGFVTLHTEGVATIKATTKDGGAEATVKITVTNELGGVTTVTEDKKHGTYKIIQDNRIIIVMPDDTKYDINGIKL